MSDTYNIVYRYYCTTEGQYVYETLVNTAAPPTGCVNDGGHTINSDSVIIYKKEFPAKKDINEAVNKINNITKNEVGLQYIENIKNNYTASRDPNANDDTGSSYSIGSRWINLSNNSTWECVDHSLAAAIWKKNSIISTAELYEDTNLFYTDARFDTRLGTKTTDDLTEGADLYYTDARFDTRLASKDTDDLVEGTTNHYYTATRFNSSIAGIDTDSLAEGSTNLYYTEARTSANTNVAANSSHRTNTSNPHQTTLSQAASQESLLQTRGDMLYTGSGGLASLGVGTEGQLLVSNGTDPTWSHYSKRFDQVLGTFTITTSYSLTATTHSICEFITSSTNNTIILPDARTINDGWTVHIRNSESSTEDLIIHNNQGTEIHRVDINSHAIIILLNNSSAAGDWEINDFREKNIIKVSQAGAHFSSVKSAIDSITDASSTNQYIVLVGPGVYTEDTINMKPYVSVQGYGTLVTVINPSDSTGTIINAASFSELFMIKIAGASGAGGIGINSDSAVKFSIRNTDISDCETLIKVTGSTGQNVTTFVGSLGGSFTTGIHIDGRSVIGSNPVIFNFLGGAVTGAVSTSKATCIEGPFANVSIIGCHYTGKTFGKGIVVSDGATLKSMGVSLAYWNTGFEAENTGNAPELNIGNIFITNCTNDINVDHPDTTGVITAMAERSKTTIDHNSTISVNYTDPVVNGTVVVGDLFIGEHHDEVTDVTGLIKGSLPLGLLSGGELTKGIGPYDLNISEGIGYIDIGTTSIHKLRKLEWGATSITLAQDSIHYIYINDSNTITTSNSLPDVIHNVVLGKIKTCLDGIQFIDQSPIRADHASTRNILFERDVIGARYISGSVVKENGNRQLDITSGIYYYTNNKFTPIGGTTLTFFEYTQTTSDTWLYNPMTVVNNTSYDSGTGPVSLTTSYYTKHGLYTVGDNNNEQYMLVMGQEEFATEQLAIDGNLPVPPNYFNEGVVPIAGIIVQEGNNNIVSIHDLRPFIGNANSGSSSSSAHGDLTGLANDDHTQYLLVDGTRSMSGNLNLGAHNLITSGLVDGVDVSSHAARHLPNGTDPLTTGAPTMNITTSTNNTTGTANSFARSDHTHAFDQTTIDHTQLQNVGTNSHTQIDTHIAANSGVHGITGSLLGDSDTQTITNKTIIGSTNTIGATQLETTGAAVVVNSADPPITGQVLRATSATTAEWVTNTSTIPVWVIRDEKSNGTYGGTFSSGVWRHRNLNTMAVNGGGEVSVSSNIFGCSAGKYKIEVSAPAYRVSSHQIRLYNITDSQVVEYGSCEYSSKSVQSNSVLTTVIDIVSTKSFRVEHRSSSSRSSYGFGIATGFGGKEVYTTVTITKIN